MDDQPKRNTQAGQQIGSRQPDPPVVAHGRRDDAVVAADPNLAAKVNYTLPTEGVLPPDETTHPETPDLPRGAGKTGELKDESSVWDARKAEGEI